MGTIELNSKDKVHTMAQSKPTQATETTRR